MYVAQAYIAGTPEAEVIGQTVKAFSENLEAEVMGDLLKKHGLHDVDAETWYPHQSWMNLLKDLEEELGAGASSAFVAFGRQVVEEAMLPPEMKTIPDMLHALHAIHHLNLRNIPAEEGYVIHEEGPNHYIIYHNTPNPDDAIYGFLWGLAARFKNPGEKFVVRKIENDRPEIARSAFELTWG